MAITGALQQDSGARYFAGPVDTATGAGKAQRGANISGEYADARVVLYDAAGNPLLYDSSAAARVSLYGQGSVAGDTALAAANGGSDARVTTENGLLTNGRAYAYDDTADRWERVRANVAGTAMASAARTSQAASSDLTNRSHHGLTVWLNVTVAGTSVIHLYVEAKDPVSGGYQRILTGVDISTTGLYTYVLAPGITSVGLYHAFANAILPRTWRVYVDKGDVSSWTYSVGYSYS